VKFSEQGVAGVHLIEAERLVDDRGFFARTYCVQAFAEAGITFPIVQGSVALNERRGTLRGLHFQAAP
jgi:dTDP-4-dehydrorhamnose 3,5-epimerase